MTDREGSTDPRPWYRDGLPFACTQCGHCCRIEGYVWMSETEIARVADYLGLEEHVFGGRYLMRVGRRWSLKEKPNFDCVFWDEGCTIYPVRPTQCRTFPFWPENVRSLEQWREVVEECPGSGTGRVYSYEEIEKLKLGIGETGGKAPDGESDAVSGSPEEDEE